MALCKRARFIYRIETADGYGPYQEIWGEYPYERARHPTPQSDHELGWDWNMRWHFGFRSMAQLKFWFYRKTWREMMAKKGFRVSKYRVPAGRARVSNAQAVFDKHEAKLVETIDLATV